VLPHGTAVQGPRARGLVEPVVEREVEREVCLITRRGRSLPPAAESLRDLILAHLPKKWAA